GTPSRLPATSGMATDAYAAAGANGRRSMVPLAVAAGAAVAIAYSTMEQFLIPLRASREFGLERAGVARLLMIAQLFDLFALIPAGVLADRQGAARVLVVNLLLMAAANALVGFGGLPVVVVGCALFGLAMTGWMLPLSVLRQETAPASPSPRASGRAARRTWSSSICTAARCGSSGSTRPTCSRPCSPTCAPPSRRPTRRCPIR